MHRPVQSPPIRGTLRQAARWEPRHPLPRQQISSTAKRFRQPPYLLLPSGVRAGKQLPRRSTPNRQPTSNPRYRMAHCCAHWMLSHLTQTPDPRQSLRAFGESKSADVDLSRAQASSRQSTLDSPILPQESTATSSAALSGSGASAPAPAAIKSSLRIARDSGSVEAGLSVSPPIAHAAAPSHANSATSNAALIAREAPGLQGAAIPPAIDQPEVSTSVRSSAPVRDAFAAIDSDSSPVTPTWVQAGAHHAEAGYEDPDLGWVSVRADVSASGVHAALVPGTPDAAAALAGHLPGLNAYLAEHRSEITHVTVAQAEARSLNSGSDCDSGNGQSARHAPHHGSGQGTNSGSHHDSPHGARTALNSHSQTDLAQSVSDSAMPPNAAQAIPLHRGLGHYISVMA